MEEEFWSSEHQSKIEEKAYYLWENAGYPQGRDLEFWTLAEKQYKEEHLEMITSPTVKTLGEFLKYRYGLGPACRIS